MRGNESLVLNDITSHVVVEKAERLQSVIMASEPIRAINTIKDVLIGKQIPNQDICESGATLHYWTGRKATGIYYDARQWSFAVKELKANGQLQIVYQP